MISDIRYRLRTLLILLAVLPPVLALAWLDWREYAEYRNREQWREATDRAAEVQTLTGGVLHSGWAANRD